MTLLAIGFQCTVPANASVSDGYDIVDRLSALVSLVVFAIVQFINAFRSTPPTLEGRVTTGAPGEAEFKAAFDGLPTTYAAGAAESALLRKVITEGRFVNNPVNIISTCLQDFSRECIPQFSDEPSKAQNQVREKKIQKMSEDELLAFKGRLKTLELNRDQIDEICELNLMDPESATQAVSHTLDRLEAFFTNREHALNAMCYLNQALYSDYRPQAVCGEWSLEHRPALLELPGPRVDESASSAITISIEGDQLVIQGRERREITKGTCVATFHSDVKVAFNKNGEILDAATSFYNPSIS